jgi:transcriptional regulator with XRE-family HTH domain
MDIKTADRLIELRKNHNLSQEALSEKLGVSRQAISKWERGESSPDTDNLIALAGIYGITLDDILNPEKQIKSPQPEPEQPKQEKEKKPAIYADLGTTLFKFPFVFILAAIYVGFNLIVSKQSLWHPTWLMFFLVPIYYHFAGACFSKTKKGFLFAQPIPELIVLIYLVLGFGFALWAKGAILFIIIPIYYWAVAFYKNHKGTKE